jgi:3-dehydroquinate synthase
MILIKNIDIDNKFFLIFYHKNSLKGGVYMSVFSVKLEKQIVETYDIEIGTNLFTKLARDLKTNLIENVSRYVIITDSNVRNIYGNDFFKYMKLQNFVVDIIDFPAGETYKSRETKSLLEDKLIDLGCRRDTCIIALGGGVVTDLVGFLAATYCRGIPVIYYATTILAAADASIGGKTAVDTPKATNYIGVFNQPKKIYIDISTWKTLTIQEVKAGLVETIKHASLSDEVFFTYLYNKIDENKYNIKNLVDDEEFCRIITMKNCEIKYDIVVRDETENNERQVLNLGHTIGRAYETICNYDYGHGECVARGLVYEAKIARSLNILDETSLNKLTTIIKNLYSNLNILDYCSLDELIVQMNTDKKTRNNIIRMVFLEKIGVVYKNNGNYSYGIKNEELYDILYKIFKE